MFHRLVLLVGAAALCLATSACTNPLLSKPAGIVAAPPAAPAVVVQSAALVQADLPHGYGADRMKKGDTLRKPTMQLCTIRFRSEELRVARHQVQYQIDPIHMVENEVVAYSTGGADIALAELKSAVAKCPVEHAKADGVPYTQHVALVDPPAGALPGTVALRLRLKVAGKVRLEGIYVFQHRGDVLSGLYLEGTGDLADRLTPLVARRLQEHPVASGQGA